MVLKRSDIIRRDKLELNISNAKAIVQMHEEMTRNEVIELLNMVLNNCYEYVPEKELELFRLPAGMQMMEC